MNLSVVIPLLNEEESLSELNDWIVKIMNREAFSYEIIYIDDGSSDGSWQVIQNLVLQNRNIKGIRFSANFGKSQALHAGFKEASGDVVVTMDADLQDNPEEIPELFHMVQDEGYDLVSGWKKVRYDAVLTKNLPSRLFNWAARKTSGLPLHDFNCGLKAYRNQVVKKIQVRGEMHRYIPVLAKNAGFPRITEKIVQHQPRKYGKTKFGIERFINGFLDLLTIWFVSKFGRMPMHFFGALGVLMFIIGFGFALYIGIDKIFINPMGRLVTERPQFFISLTAMIMGSQFFLAGFLGEIIIRNRKYRPNYNITEELNLALPAEEYSS